MAIVTMKELLEAGIHFGHQTRRWHPKMKRYIHGQRNGIYIIDLKHTLIQIYKAYGLVRDVVGNGGTVLFVGTKKQAQEPLAREAERCGMYYVNSRWLGGTLTNFQTVKRSIGELRDIEELEKTGKITAYGKKEAIQIRKRKEKLEKNLSGVKRMPKLPDVVFIIDAKREHIAVREALRLNIPCIGVVDTNCDPDVVDVPVPGNDDAIRAISLYCKLIADAAIEGRMRSEKIAADRAEKEVARHREDEDQVEAEPAAGAEDDAVEGAADDAAVEAAGETPVAAE